MPSSSNINLTGCRVLVVDDDPVNNLLLADILTSAGFAVAEATSGEAALESFETTKPDLVLLDIRLPGIDGLDTCRELKRRYGSNCPPVIFITSRNTPEDVVAGFSAGGVDYLAKPVFEREALARIRTHLSNRILVRQLGDALAKKNQFLGVAAHDLRNPLSTIRGMAELLREGAIGPVSNEQREIIDLVHEASDSMLGFVNELLDVAVIESGQLKLTLAPTNLSELVARTVHFNNINAARKNTTIQLQPKVPEVHANVDGRKIRQVVENLLTNAVKYSPLGSTINVSLQEKSGAAVISVRDQGPGIPEQERSRLFQDFSTLSVKSTAGEQSTGLGLAICRRIIEAHRGTISASNLPSGGCEFLVTLPANA